MTPGPPTLDDFRQQAGDVTRTNMEVVVFWYIFAAVFINCTNTQHPVADTSWSALSYRLLRDFCQREPDRQSSFSKMPDICNFKLVESGPARGLKTSGVHNQQNHKTFTSSKPVLKPSRCSHPEPCTSQR